MIPNKKYKKGAEEEKEDHHRASTELRDSADKKI